MKPVLRFPIASLVVALLAAAAGDATTPPPNFVLILADDLGYGDVRCYNPDRGKIPTPHIDRLAAEGIRFTDGHSSSGVCSPSRYTLLTGRYHWRTRLQAGIVGYLEGPLIPPDRLTIGSLVQRRGYRTAAIGKWHLGWEWNIPTEQRVLFAPPRGRVPPVTDQHRRAWQEVYSRPIGGGPTTRGFDEYFGTDVPNWPPFCFIEQNRTVGIPTEFLPAALLKPHLASRPGPAVAHWKLEEVLPAIARRAVEFIERETRANRPFLLYLPLTSPHTPIAVAPEWRGRSGLCDYIDFVMQTDAVVGQVLEALDRAGIASNTFVLFTSDNGCAAHGWKPSEAVGHFPSGPLRGYKASVYEGGHRVPFIIRWPAVAPGGRVCGQLVQQADLFATIAEILEVPLPDNAGEDSFSLLPLLRGEDRPIRPDAVNCAGHGWPSLRVGPWKFIPGTSAELYDLATDIGETRNLAAQHPEGVEQMKARLEEIIARGRSTPGPPQTNDVAVRRYFDEPGPVAVPDRDGPAKPAPQPADRGTDPRSPAAQRKDTRR